MKIIITGGTGFLGKRLCRKLEENDHAIMSYDIVNGYDILNVEQMEETIKSFKPDTIIHLAACADLNIFAKKPEISYKINVIGTRNILKLCQKYNARLLFASTCCCYGNNETHPTDETSPTCPTEPYAKSKKKSEKDILEVGLPHCCMRLATFYGPEMRAALAPAVFIDKAHKNETIEVHGSGKQTRTLTYVDDIVSGIITIVENKPKYTIINVTTEEITSVLDMIKQAKNLTGNKVKCINVVDREGQIHEEIIHSKRLQSLGWKWKTTFEEGMEKSYKFYLKNREKW
ncbi:MAG: NAD(P)-dependent oxidoreductase [Firmicutes bacterium]|nr:NAD(P)-dependent oxidoreductase [Bacillota bacterium]